MVKLDVVRKSNTEVVTLGKLVAVFVGGTSGIGESTLLALASKAFNPTIYVVGRNELAAERILQKLQLINAGGSYEFIKSDVSVLRNVDVVCNYLHQKEKVINLLFLSQGYLSFANDGIDRRMSLAYYSRARFMQKLLPMMSSPARIVSVFRGGRERMIDGGNLGRMTSLRRLASYGATMTTLLMAKFAQDHPGVSFVHVYPGLVRTNLWSGFGSMLGLLIGILIWPFSLSVAECGERNLFHLTSPRYSPSRGQKPRGSVHKKTQSIQGRDGELIRGVYSINWDGEERSNQALHIQLRGDLVDRVWSHTYNVFEKAEAIALLTRERSDPDRQKGENG